MEYTLVGVGAASIFFFFAAWGYFYRRSVLKNAVKIEATVVDILETVEPGGGGSTYAPMYRYTVDGKEYKTMGTDAVKWGALSVGEQVMIRYHKDDPYKIVGPGEDKPITSGELIAFGSGILFLLVAFFTIRS